MKKFLGIPLAIIAAMTAVSCIDEIDDPVSDDQQGELVEMTFTASFADDTKTTLTKNFLYFIFTSLKKCIFR